MLNGMNFIAPRLFHEEYDLLANVRSLLMVAILSANQLHACGAFAPDRFTEADCVKAARYKHGGPVFPKKSLQFRLRFYIMRLSESILKRAKRLEKMRRNAYGL